MGTSDAGGTCARSGSITIAGRPMPSCVSFRPIFALPSAQIRQSHMSASTQPPAIAWPLIAATSGFGHASTRCIARAKSSMNARIAARSRSTSRGSASPAEKNRS